MDPKIYSNKFISTAAVFVLLCVIVIVFYVLQTNTPNAKNIDQSKLRSATLLDKPRSISSFKLIDDDNHIFSNQNLKGHWTLMFFGFTHCPHICPTTIAELSKTYTKLNSKISGNLPQVVMVSVDPERDTVTDMNKYINTFNKAFVGTTGNRQAIERLTKELGIVHMKIQHNNDASAVNYNIEHSGTILLINPNGELAGFFSMPHDADRIASDYQMIIG